MFMSRRLPVQKNGGPSWLKTRIVSGGRPGQAKGAIDDTGTEVSVSEAPVVSTDTAKAASETETGSKPQTGLFYLLPHISPPNELVTAALRRARRVSRNKKLQGPAAQERNLTARQMDRLMKELTLPLNKYLCGFPITDRMHKFESALLDLTVTQDRYYRVLTKVLQLRKTATTMGKEYAGRCGKAESKKSAAAIAEEGFTAMESLFKKNQGVMLDLVDIARKLRQLPKLDLGIPTLALVGAPNVGKSSLVQSISSGRPEICNYPFTTRSIKMGHFYVDGIRHQVTDTPGLLNRPEDERNSMELLTIATLRHLPTAVCFVMDVTEECGTSIADQLSIRSNLRRSFESKPWIDVFSKADLLQEAIEKAENAPVSISSMPQADKSTIQARILWTLPEAARVSCMTLQGMEAFKRQILQSLSVQKSKTVAENAYEKGRME